LYELFKEPDIIVVMRKARLRWAGHVIRMSASEMQKRSMNFILEGKRVVERRKARWTDPVDKDMRKAGVTNWRIEGKDTYGWRRILEEARVHIGLYLH
jgi:hypothetical protein